MNHADESRTHVRPRFPVCAQDGLSPACPEEATDMPDLQILRRPLDAAPAGAVNPFGLQAAREALAFHRSFPEYSPTPLVRLRGLAEALGAGEIFVKDESLRFGLNAFKALGGSHAIARCIAQRLGLDFGALRFDHLTSPQLRRALGDVTFVTATDGNHGRGVAWTAMRLGQRSVVYMPQGTAPERLENIRRLGADASILDMPYDDCVRHARAQAEDHGWILVQDTSWSGYEQIPLWIMQGYTTMGMEILEQLQGIRPTHILLQAGVGAMAGAMAAFFAACWRDAPPTIILVEPQSANCFFRTAAANDGALHAAPGPMRTIMAGLACGEPCSIAWDVLSRCAEFYVSMPDWVAAKGMRTLAAPLPGDARVISGESGAATLGFAAVALERPDLRAQLGLDEGSRILCISTEGDTDRDNYRRIVWDGLHPAP